MNESLRDALHRAADDAGVVPQVSGHDLLRRARRTRTRRRATSVVVATACAGVAVGLGSLMTRPTAEVIPAVPPTIPRATFVPATERVLTWCAQAKNTPDEDLPVEVDLFGEGASVITFDKSVHGVAAFVLSPDRRFFAECHVSFDSDDDWVHEYDAQAPATGGVNTFYLGTRSFAYRDRFPADVVRVEFQLCQEGTVSARAVDGFVAVYRDAESDPCRMRLYGAGGRVLAEGDLGQLPPRYDSLLPGARR